MGAREADALDPVDRVASAQQLPEFRPNARREVTTPGIDILTEQRDLLHAVPRESFELGDDLARTPALLPSADRGDDAVGALRVAAHRDLNPRAEPALTVHWQRCGEGLVRSEAASRHGMPTRLDPRAQMRERSRSERDVDEGVALEDAVVWRLRGAAAHGDDDIRLPALSRGRVSEIGGQPGVGLLSDRAGVADEYVLLFRFLGVAEPDPLLDPFC